MEEPVVTGFKWSHTELSVRFPRSELHYTCLLLHHSNHDDVVLFVRSLVA